MAPSASVENGASGATNGASSPRALVRGIYVPTVAFFNPETDELDLKSTARHVLRLAESGVAGVAVQGSNGEAIHLMHEERSSITKATRAALDGAGFQNMPVIVGCGAESVVEAVALCKQAAASGGDYALILPPSFYNGLFAKDTIVNFFERVADASPIPVIIYNYPGATRGVDVDSDTLITLSKHANIAGCKFTCGNTGKLGRVSAAVRARGAAEGFRCFAGSVDFLLPAIAAGADGVIGGLANVAPRISVKLWENAQAGKTAEAQKLQEVIAEADWTAIQTGVLGVKAAMNEFYGYGGFARQPMPRPDAAQVANIADGMRAMVDVEKTLEA